jgi:hypothetical protein
MANPNEDIKKQVDPAIEEMKKQAATYDALKKKTSSYEDLKKETNAYEELKKQAAAYEELKKQVGPAYPGEIPYSAQLRTLREKLDMLASNPNSDLHEISQCINAITFFENQQSKRMAELRKEAQGSSVLGFDNQSILQTSSVRKKDPAAIDPKIWEPELQKMKQNNNKH